jgi:hypothetical protein
MSVHYFADMKLFELDIEDPHVENWYQVGRNPTLLMLEMTLCHL